MNLSKAVVCGLVLSFFVSHGCVRPGVEDVNDVYRLQQAVLARSPQDRPAEGLGLMRPTEDSIPAHEITKDPKTNRRMVKLTLQDAVMRALANNPDIAVVSYTPEISRQQVIQAAAAFDYTLFGSIGYTRTDTAQAHRTGLGVDKQRDLAAGIRQNTAIGTQWQLTSSFVRSWDDATTDRVGRWYQGDLDLQVTQPLLRGAWPEVNLAGLRIARLQHKISMSEFRAQVEATVVSVITAYYQLTQARREVAIAERLLERTQETYRKVKARQAIDATTVQIKQAEAAVKTRQAFLVNSKKNLGDVQDTLVRLLGDKQINLLQEFDMVPTTDMTRLKVKIDSADQLLTALRLNPELEQLRFAIRQAEINVRVAKWNTLPELNLSAGTTLNGGSRKSRGIVWDDMVSGKFASYNAALTLEYPIGNRARLAALAESRLTRFQVVAQMQTTADTIAQGIRERIREIQARFEELKIQKEALEANKEQLAGLEALEKIRAQLTPEFLNLKLNAQASVAQSERAELAALVAYNVAMLDLSQATGTVMELNQVKLALPVVSKMPTFQNATTEPAK
ncbi:MAG: TolC family protein [Phycisphaerae bacterium]|nr:TolC family protein [Phycisphaerae bacterium]